MAIYTDTDSGNDTTGDGTELLPYLTVNHAVTTSSVMEVHYVWGSTDTTIIQNEVTSATNAYNYATIMTKPGETTHKVILAGDGGNFFFHQTKFFGLDLDLDSAGGAVKFSSASGGVTYFSNCYVKFINGASNQLFFYSNEEGSIWDECTIDFNGQDAQWILGSQLGRQVHTFNKCILKDIGGLYEPFGGTSCYNFNRCVFYNMGPSNPANSMFGAKFGAVGSNCIIDKCTFIIKKQFAAIFNVNGSDYATQFTSNIVYADGVFCSLFTNANTFYGGMNSGSNVFNDKITVGAQYTTNALYSDFTELTSSPFISIDPLNADFAKVKVTEEIFEASLHHIGQDVGGLNNAQPPAVYTDPGIANVKLNHQYTFNDVLLQGTYDADIAANLPDESDVTLNILYGTSNQFTGSSSLTCPVNTNPGIENVRDGVGYIIDDVPYVGLIESPSEDDVRDGVLFDETGAGQKTGNVRLPAEADVRLNDIYDSTNVGLEKTGALDVAVEANLPAEGDVRKDVNYGTASTGTVIVPVDTDVRNGTAVDVANTGSADIPSEDDVRSGTAIDATVGNLRVPADTKVELGEVYDSTNPVLEKTGNVRIPSIFDVKAQELFGANDSLTGESVTYTIDPGRVPLRLYTSDGSDLSITTTTPTKTEYFIDNSTEDQIDQRLDDLGIAERISLGSVTFVTDPENSNLLALRIDR